MDPSTAANPAVCQHCLDLAASGTSKVDCATACATAACPSNGLPWWLIVGAVWYAYKLGKGK